MSLENKVQKVDARRKGKNSSWKGKALRIIGAITLPFIFAYSTKTAKANESDYFPAQNQEQILRTDFNGDGIVDFKDFAEFAEQWLEADQTESIIKVCECQELTEPNRVYVLQNNITGISGDCFTIKADGIKLLMEGKSITGGGEGRGIYCDNYNNIAIQNGKIYGFETGIDINGNNIKIMDMTTNNNLGEGIKIINSSNITVNNIITKNNKMGYGIDINSTSGSKTISNVESRNNAIGVRIYNSDRAFLENINISDSNITGLDINYSNNTSLNNISVQNADWAFICDYSKGTNVKNSSFLGGKVSDIILDNRSQTSLINVNYDTEQIYPGNCLRGCTSCDSFSDVPTDCENQSGCYWEGCDGIATSCDGLSEAECGATTSVPQYGCKWSGSHCEGTVEPCDTFDMFFNACNWQDGCGWVACQSYGNSYLSKKVDYQACVTDSKGNPIINARVFGTAVTENLEFMIRTEINGKTPKISLIDYISRGSISGVGVKENFAPYKITAEKDGIISTHDYYPGETDQEDTFILDL